MLLYFGPRLGAFLSDSATIKQYLLEKDLFYENKKKLFLLYCCCRCQQFPHNIQK